MTLPALTIGDVITDTRKYLLNDIVQADGSDQYSDSFLVKILMELGSRIAALDLAASTETLITTIQNQAQYAFPSDTFWWPKQAFIQYSGQWYPLTFDILNNIVQTDLFSTNMTGVPNLFYIMDNKINFYPIPDMPYSVKIVSEKRFPELDTTASGIATTLALSFYAYFDPAYKYICARYIRLMVQVGRNDKNALSSYNSFFNMSDSNSDWRFIVGIENKKNNFDAKNRRAGGDVSQNYSDYPISGGILG